MPAGRCDAEVGVDLGNLFRQFVDRIDRDCRFAFESATEFPLAFRDDIRWRGCLAVSGFLDGWERLRC